MLVWEEVLIWNPEHFYVLSFLFYVYWLLVIIAESNVFKFPIPT